MKKLKIFSSRDEAEMAFESTNTRRLSISGTKICMAKYNDKYFAIEDKCPHSMASLSEGSINTFGEIVCPLHGYCYSLKDGREKSEKTRDAKVYEIVVEENGIFIKFTG